MGACLSPLLQHFSSNIGDLPYSPLGDGGLPYSHQRMGLK